MWKPGQSRNPAGHSGVDRTWRTAPQCRYFLTALIDRIDVGANQISRLGLRLGEVMFDPCAVVFASLRRQRDQTRLLDPTASGSPNIAPRRLGVYGGMNENFVLVAGRSRWPADGV
jgi:hypothetical protein